MLFQPGNKASPGRPKGSKNKRSVEFAEALKNAKFDNAKQLMWVFREARGKYRYYSKCVKSGRYSPMEDKAPQYLKICGDMVKEIVSYSLPKLKAIEITLSPFDDKTVEEKLAATLELAEKLRRELQDAKR